MTDRDPDYPRAPVLPLRHPVAGGVPDRSAVIVSITDLGGRRVSTIRRGDGSAFTVTVPAGGIDTYQGQGPPVPWIREHGGHHRAPTVALDGLAARVGMHLVAVHPPRPPQA